MAETDFMKAYEAYADPLFRYCYYRVSDRELAKDMVQEVFMKTWEYLAQGTHVDNLRAFLYRVARNLVIDNSRRKRPISLDELKDQGFDPGADERPTLETRIDARSVYAQIDRLEESYREILVLRFGNGLPPKEIAVILGISSNVVSVRIHRGIKQLRQLLKE